MTNKIQYNISLNPTQEQIEQIEKWLLEESKIKNNDGFYCNWNTIYNSHLKNRCGVITIHEVVIGFGTWSIYDSTSKIEIVEIHPKYRRKGYGEILIKALINFFITQNIIAVSADCMNKKSEKLMRKINFLDFPEHEYKWRGEHKEVYKVIIPSLQITDKTDGTEYIELWDNEPYRTDIIEPKWRWNIKFKVSPILLEYPIVFPCDGDWRIRWIKNKTVIKDDKVKYFAKDDILFGTFMRIDKLET